MTANPDFWEDDSYLSEQRYMEEHAAAVVDTRPLTADVSEIVFAFGDGDGALLPDIDYVLTGRR